MVKDVETTDGETVEPAPRPSSSPGSSSAAPPLDPFSLREMPLGILCALTALLFSGPLFRGETMFLRDLSIWAFPQRRRLIELWKSSGLPLRDPFIHGGLPFLANLNDAALYPTGALGFLFGPVWATNFEIALHVGLCAVAAYALARVLGFGRAASFVAGAAFGFAGPTLSLGNLLNRMLAMPHLAFFLLFWHLYLRDRRRLWFALCAVTGALMVFAGSVETLGLSLLLAFGWSLFIELPEGSWRIPRRLVAFAGVTVILLGLAAVQILPTQRLIVRSARKRMTYETAAEWSLNPRRLPEAAFPGFLGRPESLDTRDYWGLRMEPSYPYLWSIYLGAPVLLLAAVGAVRRGRLPRRLRIFLLLAPLGLLLIALGRFLPVHRLLYEAIPAARLFRFPIKILTAATLPIALLAANGMEIVFGESRRGERPGLPRPLVVGLSAFAAAALLFLLPPTRHAIEAWILHGQAEERADAGIVGSVLRAVAPAALLALLAATAKKWPARAAWGAAAVVAADLLLAHRGVNPTVPATWMEAAPPIVPIIRPLLKDGRFYSEPLPAEFELRSPTNNELWYAEWARQVLGEYRGAMFDVPAIFHQDPDNLAPDRLVVAGNFLNTLPWERRLPLLSAASVRVFVSHAPVTQPDVESIGEIPNRSNRRFFAYRNDRAAPAVAIVTDWVAADSAARSAAAATDPAFDPRRVAIVETRSPLPAPDRCAGASVQVQSRDPKRTVVEANSPCRALAVFSEPWDEGWEAFVDGRRSPIAVANLLFSAVPLPAGTHHVEMRYRPPSVSRGAAISAIALAALGVFVLTGRKRKPAISM